MFSRLWPAVLTGLGCLLASALALASPMVQDQEKIEEALKIFNRAKFLHQEGNYQDAILEYQRAARLDKQNPWIFNYLGLAMTSTGDFKGALGALQTALKLNPDITDVHNNLGVLYSEMGEREKAFQEFTLVVRDPSYPTAEKAFYNLGNLYLAEGNYELALMHYRRAVEKKPNFAMGYRGMGKVSLQQGQIEEAKEQFEKALEVSQEDVESLFELARIHERLGALDLALDYYRKVIEIDRFSTLGKLSLTRLNALKPSN